MLPVPPELAPKVWGPVRTMVRKIPGYNVERTYVRLLAGVDQLWVAHGMRPSWDKNPDGRPRLVGAIITSISPRPPQQRKAFQRKDPALMKSLTIHLAGETAILSWLDSAIERINLYARQHGCRMLFILARKGWQKHLKRWYSKEWEAVAIGRDRPTVSKCSRLRKRNTPGYFRLMIPIPAERWRRWHSAFTETCRFKEVA